MARFRNTIATFGIAALALTGAACSDSDGDNNAELDVPTDVETSEVEIDTPDVTAPDVDAPDVDVDADVDEEEDGDSTAEQ